MFSYIILWEKVKNNGNRVFFIGVGGISMSALAKLTKHGGNVVAGSDAQNSHIIEGLKTQFKVFVGHNEKNIKHLNQTWWFTVVQ